MATCSPALDRLLDLMLTARLAEELAKPECDRVSEHVPSPMFAWHWGKRQVGSREKHWVRIVWHGRTFEEEASSKNEAAKRLLMLHMDPDGEADEEMAA